jgi:hypothetical protein
MFETTPQSVNMIVASTDPIGGVDASSALDGTGPAVATGVALGVGSRPRVQDAAAIAKDRLTKNAELVITTFEPSTASTWRKAPAGSVTQDGTKYEWH